MRRLGWQLALIIVVLAVVSCGGTGNSPTAQASLRFSITWPNRSRLIPIAANSIRVRVLVDNTEIDRAVIPRPSGTNSSTVTLDDLPPRTVLIDATAYPSTDATGTAQAFGKLGLTLTGGVTNQATVTMASTITKLALSADTTSPLAGTDAHVSAAAQNAAGALVLVSDATMSWSSSDPAILKPDAQGTSVLVHALKAGNATLTATETESQVSASIPMTVVSPYPLIVPPTVDVTGVGPWTYQVSIPNHTDHSVILQDLALDHYDKDGAFVATQWVKDDVPTFSFTYWAINHTIQAGGTEQWTIITDPGSQVSGQLAEMTVIFRATVVDGVNQSALTGQVELTRNGISPAPPILNALGTVAPSVAQMVGMRHAVSISKNLSSGG